MLTSFPGNAMRRIGMLSMMVVLFACASSGAVPRSAPTETLRVAGAGGGALTLTSSSQANATSVPFPVEQVWRVLPAVYDSLEIPITTLDGAKRLVGNSGLTLRRQLGKVSLSRYINCGSTQIGENADSYEVHLTVMTTVQPDESGLATVATTFEAMAKPITFAQNFSRCTSKGVLEKRIADAIELRLQR